MKTESLKQWAGGPKAEKPESVSSLSKKVKEHEAALREHMRTPGADREKGKEMLRTLNDMQDKLSDAKGNRAIATSMARGAAKAAKAAAPTPQFSNGSNYARAAADAAVATRRAGQDGTAQAHEKAAEAHRVASGIARAEGRPDKALEHADARMDHDSKAKAAGGGGGDDMPRDDQGRFASK